MDGEAKVMKARYIKYNLEFKRPAGTSRGVMRSKETYFLFLEHEGKIGVGECNLFKGLSYDDRPTYEQKLQWLVENIGLDPVQIAQELQEWPSILFGYETALRSFQSANTFELFPSAFTQGKDSVPINGLIWMGDIAYMTEQIDSRLDEGFTCLKVKIGALDWEAELAMLKTLRSRYSSNKLELRADANGAFATEEALQKLQQLAELEFHSIEQPIRQGQLEQMAVLCANTPVPIALDEELIGVVHNKLELLKAIKPQYIILKPALLGGYDACRKWIEAAESLNIDWWITSALESNIGLNSVAQFTYTLGIERPQGLGTGRLFTNNFESPLTILNATLTYDPETPWSFNL